MPSPVTSLLTSAKLVVYRNTLFLQYEKLTSQPAEETRRIFEFISSAHQGGVQRYGEYAWRSGLHAV